MRSSSTPKSRRSILLLEGVALLSLLTLLVWPSPPRATIHWVVKGEASKQIARVPAHTPVHFHLALEAESYVYAVQHDLVTGYSALFPSAFLKSDIPDNPLPPGHHAFPGTWTEVAMSWSAGASTTPVTFAVLVSEQPLENLTAALSSCRQMGNAAFPKRPLLGGYAPDEGLDSAPAPGDVIDDTLNQAMRLGMSSPTGELQPLEGFPGVWVSVLRLQVEGGGAQSEAEIREELQQLLGEVQSTPPTPAKSGR